MKDNNECRDLFIRCGTRHDPPMKAGGFMVDAMKALEAIENDPFAPADTGKTHLNTISFSDNSYTRGNRPEGGFYIISAATEYITGNYVYDSNGTRRIDGPARATYLDNDNNWYLVDDQRVIDTMKWLVSGIPTYEDDGIYDGWYFNG